jgi:uncharacterized protein YjbI with pentapeptide repeats
MLKCNLPEMPKKKILFALGVVLAIAAVGFSQPILWPGGFGIGKDQAITTKSVETVVKDAQGNTTKTIETTKNDDGKTLWDWLSLLGVPVSLAVLGYILQQLQQRRAEVLAKEQRAIATDETKEEVMQAYFDRLSVLLVDKNLLAIAAKKDRATDEERELLASGMKFIRARTLSILRRFENDPERKTSVIRLLIEADIVSKLKLDLSFANLNEANLGGANFGGATLIKAELKAAILTKADLRGADLRGADLSNAYVGDADLSGADLRGADLSDANLHDANLSEAKLGQAILSDARLTGTRLGLADFTDADLTDADLSDADLSDADLSDADLSNASLSGAVLHNANLTKAHNLTAAQLHRAKLCHTKLPISVDLNPNRDCQALGIPENQLVR